MNRTNADLFLPFVHHPLFLPHVPYEFLMASHILGFWPANILCKFFFTPKRLLPKVPMAMFGFLVVAYHFLYKA